MKKGIFDAAKRELMYVGLLFLAFTAILKMVYFNDDLTTAFRMALSLLWLFALPGYFITFYWRENLEFAERLVIGIALAAAISGIFSYYLGLIGLDIRYHTILLPSAIIAIGFATIKE